MVHSLRNTLAVNTIKQSFGDTTSKEYGSLNSNQVISQLHVYTNDMRMEYTNNWKHLSTYSLWSKVQNGSFSVGDENSHIGLIGYSPSINKFYLTQFVYEDVNTPPVSNVYYSSWWFFDVPVSFTYNQSSWNHYCLVTEGYGMEDKQFYINGTEMPLNWTYSSNYPVVSLFDRNAIIFPHYTGRGSSSILYDNVAISDERLTPQAVAHIASSPSVDLTIPSGAYTSTHAASWNGLLDFEQPNYVVDVNGHKIISTDISGTYAHNLSFTDINLSSDSV